MAEKLRGEIQKNRRGFAFLLLEDTEDLYIPEESARDLISGDIVEVTVRGKDRRILDLILIKRTLRYFVGPTFSKGNKQLAVLKDITMEETVLLEPFTGTPALKNNDKVLVEITSFQPRMKGRVLENFGKDLSPKEDTRLCLIQAQWPEKFSSSAWQQAVDARELLEQPQKNRKDLKEIPFVTIDGATARDFDDAIAVEQHHQGYKLYVAIADVSYFVKENSILDREARDRSTSVYFADSVSPMLPEIISNDLCSLRPQEDKFVLVCEMDFDSHGRRKKTKVYEAVICSKRRCIYEDVQKEFNDGDPFWKIPYQLYSLLKKDRINRGTLDLDLPEAKLILDEESRVTQIVKEERLDSHRLIEEFMIAANEAVCDWIGKAPFLYRIHEVPNAEALDKFKKFSSALGLKFEFSEEPTPKEISKILKKLQGHRLQKILHYMLLRALKQAKYSAKNVGHFGLASKAYTHFTSPIRRYPDLVVHRLLRDHVHRSAPHKRPLAEWALHCSKLERKASELERKVEKIKKARFMKDRYGEVYDGVITNISESGFFVELLEPYVEGMVPFRELRDDYYEVVPERFLARGRRKKRVIRLGDTVRVQVLRCDTELGLIDFILA